MDGKNGWNKGNRPKMDKADRAKQFLPFDALKGFREALAEKERNHVPQGELEVEEDLSDFLSDF